jgi:hypothetical protein
MKLELPLAIVLLAAGSLLWTAQIGQKNQTGASSQTGEKATVAGNRTNHATSNPLGQRGNPGDSPSATTDSTSREKADRSGFASSLQATYLVQQSAANLLNSVPLEANVRITMDLFQQPLVANGRYYQQGQGTTKARLEFANGTGDNAIKITQLCDGRFNFSKQTVGHEKLLESVDLEKVAEASQSTAAGLVNPASILSIGSVSSLMQNLAQWFDFETPSQTELGGISMLRVKGQWKPQILKSFISDLVDDKLLEPEINWGEVPPQIPHAVEITLGNDQFLPLFPYRIVFLQYGDNPQAGDRQVMQLELFEVGKLNQLAENAFNIDSEDTQPVDTTERYVQRIQQYQSMTSKSFQASKEVDATRR